MNVEKITKPNFPYKFHVNVREEICQLNDMIKWSDTKEAAFTGLIVGASVYLRTEEDVVNFMLRWA